VDVIRVAALRLRSYNVGFGDCFLLSITYDDQSKRHVLIDFGSTAMPKSPSSMEVVARQIADDCDNKLTMVVATHRHADHISGFAGKAGQIIAGLKPDLVVQPWTEDPALDPKATTSALSRSKRAAAGLTTSLAAMQAVAASVALEGAKLTGTKRLPPTVVQRIRFLGDTNLSNVAAVKNLASMGKNIYAQFGTVLPIKKLLPDVRIDVLGPPTLSQEPGIAQMASKDAQEYWHLAAQRAPRSSTGDAAPLFPHRRRVAVPQAAKWLVPQIDRAHADEMLGIVRILDDALNNTSLILLMKIGSTTLLFPGDAQIENWRHALFNAKDRAAIRARLAKTTVYKVGHHGSLNATPKTLWASFEHRSADAGRPGRLQTMMSTKPGKHGDSHRGTEVPRSKLVKALDAESELHNTSTLRGGKTFWRDVPIPPPPPNPVRKRGGS
jgi:hypothetical protein